VGLGEFIHFTILKLLLIPQRSFKLQMTPMQVIRLVGEHMSGKVTLSPLNLNQQVDVTLGAIASVLGKRQAAMKLKPQDSNAATHLIR